MWPTFDQRLLPAKSLDNESPRMCSLSPPRSVCSCSDQRIVKHVLADFGQAEEQFERIFLLDPYRVDDIDVFSNILYVTDNRLKLSRLAHEFLDLDKDRPEICCLVGVFIYILSVH